MKVSKFLRIYGKVQGVFYRESMRQECMKMGVTGWVRNLKDGSVEALVQGEEPLVLAIIEWAKKGPIAANVERLEQKEASNEPALSQFDRKQSE